KEMFAAFTIGSHFAISAAMNAFSSSGLPPARWIPRLEKTSSACELFQVIVGRGIEFRDDGCWRAGGREQRIPHTRFKPGQPRFRDSGHLRQRGPAMGA